MFDDEIDELQAAIKRINDPKTYNRDLLYVYEQIDVINERVRDWIQGKSMFGEYTNEHEKTVKPVLILVAEAFEQYHCRMLTESLDFSE